MLIACRFSLRHNVHRRCLSGKLTIVPVGIWSWFCYTSTCTCMPLEQFDHVSSSTMSCNVRDNYFVGKTHLKIWKCLFINLLLINSLYSIDTCIRSFRSFLFVEKKLKHPIWNRTEAIRKLFCMSFRFCVLIRVFVIDW